MTKFNPIPTFQKNQTFTAKNEVNTLKSGKNTKIYKKILPDPLSDRTKTAPC